MDASLEVIIESILVEEYFPIQDPGNYVYLLPLLPLPYVLFLLSNLIR